MVPTLPSLLAVHISGGVLAWPWVIGSFAAAAGLVWLAARRVRDDEVPRIALFTAAFFVAGLIHIRIGPTSAHLLLNGLVGVLLGRRAPLAVAVGVLLQAFLLGHGDISTVGVNTCVMAIPALLAGGVYRGVRRAPKLGAAEASLAVSFVLCPWSLLLAGPLVFALKRLERRVKMSVEFRAGFLTGVITVLLTVALNGLTLAVAGEEDWRVWAVVSFAAHLPVALVEGVITAFVVNFLARTSPGLLPGLPAPTDDSVSATLDEVPQLSGNNSSSGTSH